LSSRKSVGKEHENSGHSDAPGFLWLRRQLCDVQTVIIFGPFVGMAIYWRKKPEYHRWLMFIASCRLMDDALGRFDFMLDHNPFFPALNGLILLGMARDSLVDGRVHKVYLYALPAMIVIQSFAIYLWRVNSDAGWFG